MFQGSPIERSGKRQPAAPVVAPTSIPVEKETTLRGVDEEGDISDAPLQDEMEDDEEVAEAPRGIWKACVFTLFIFKWILC